MENKKRIAFIIGSMGRGGAERVVSIISNHYAEKGWEVDIILLLGGTCAYKLSPKIRIITLGNKNKCKLIQLFNLIVGIRSYLINYKPDCILAFQARINIIAAIAGMGLKKHFVVSERNDPERDGRPAWVRIGTYLTYSGASKVIFQTKIAQSYYSQRIIRNSEIIYNPVNVSTKFKKMNSKKIVAVGRLQTQKNHALLIRAFREIHDIFPEYSLIIYGEGTLRTELENMVAEMGLTKYVFMPGSILNIHEEISKADFFVLSSDFEGLSNALLEAMMMGMPCISTDCAGSNEIIVSGKNGILVPIGVKNKLVEAMTQLINNDKFALKLGMEAERTADQFSSNIIIRKWESVLEQ